MTDVSSNNPAQKPPHSLASLSNHRCAYCGGPPVSRDHVPPKGWFAREVKTRIRVPSCELCNNGRSKEDDEFRVILGMLAGLKTLTQKLLWRKAQKSLRQMPKYRTALARQVFRDEKTGLSGIQFSRAFFDRNMARVVRGLHWHHYHEMVDPAAPVTVWRISKEGHEKIRGTLEVDLQSNHIGHDQFTYMHGRPIEDPSLSIWLLAFYRSVFVGVITGRKIEDDEFATLTEPAT